MKRRYFYDRKPLAAPIALQHSRTSIARLFSDSDMQINHLCDVSIDCWRTALNARGRVLIISGTERNGGTHCDWPVDGIGHR